jgi:hypothetical protein
MASRLILILALVVVVPASTLAYEGDGIIEDGEDETAELQRAVQNPVANLISLPFQNNTSYNSGPRDRTQNVHNIQPVIPLSINEDWNLITRTIFPIVSQPSFARGQDRKTGIGDTTLSLFASPMKPAAGGLIWGAGPIALIPTASDDRLGPGKWGAGVSVVGLAMFGPMVAGSVISNVWSLEGEDFSFFTWQYFVNYNFTDGWYLTSSPIMTANWDGPHDAWTVPVGGGFGKVHRFGNLPPVNLSVQAFYNAEKTEFGADWSTRFQIQLLFPR